MFLHSQVKTENREDYKNYFQGFFLEVYFTLTLTQNFTLNISQRGFGINEPLKLTESNCI